MMMPVGLFRFDVFIYLFASKVADGDPELRKERDRLQEDLRQAKVSSLHIGCTQVLDV
jgi:hypothetical protein